jgi:D-alanyl-D-alanine carboxypeptidase
MSFQDELNRINKTSNLSVRDCLKTLAGGDANRSTNALANAYGGTTNQSIQVAMNVKAGRNWTAVGLLTKQDAAKLIATPA